MKKEYKIVLVSEDSSFEDQIEDMNEISWPKFIRNSDIDDWGKLETVFPEFQFQFVINGKLIAMGNTVPFYWDGNLDSLPESINDIILRAIEDKEKGIKPNTISALAAMISPDYKDKKLSIEILDFMKQLGKNIGCKSLVAPVRPTLKKLYPLTPFEEYIKWKNENGNHFDPWIRTHANLGAKVLKIQEKCMSTKGTIQEWEEWTNMKFPVDGQYIVKGAFNPITIDYKNNLGLYIEENLWMEHKISACISSDKTPNMK